MITFRWFGARDRVPLAHIRQIPAVRGIVSALFDIPVGDALPRARLLGLREEVERHDLALAVIESIPVHEDIKLGRPTRDRYIDNYCESIRSMGREGAGIPVLCYNFMPVFDWLRTDLARRLADGSTALAYEDSALARIDLSRGTAELPGWATAYSAGELQALLAAYRTVGPDQLWDNLAYFLERVVPVASASDVKMALHPDDPPWSIFGLPRIITDGAALDRVTDIVDDPANGITFCTGSLGANANVDLPATARRLSRRKRIHFAHCRNIRRTGPKSFEETAHPSERGDVDMRGVLGALAESGFQGPIRSDHGRMIWGEQGQPGYGLYDRALGAMYLHGLWEGLNA
ncbi:MAG TPA: mannonate dehydratase [Gemmatimonadaceae bacterium]|nr:mannonate dehydratase [Gemmatimonadaceae bacterium]